MDFQQALDAGFEAVKGYIDRSVSAFAKRLAAVEARVPERGERGLPGQNGRDGRDADPVTPEQIAEAVEQYLKANPPAAGANGRDGVDGKDGEPGRDGKDGNPGRDGKDGINGVSGENGADGKDGVSLAGAMIDRDGNLVVTLSNGEHKQLGAVIGRDGTDGACGKDGASGADGKDGVDGVDGLGFDDLDLVETDDGIVLRFTRGDIVKEFPLPVVVDRGVWREGGYRKGNGVTWGGSFWIAKRDTDEKPETSDAWRLAVKRGRDGKPGDPGKKGDPGPKGNDGRDLTQIGVDGAKW